jgi:hypothetical protein
VRKHYHRLARDKQAALKAMGTDAGVLFKVVDSETNCMCGGTCDSCSRSDVCFFDLVVRAKSVSESDLLALPNASQLDWRAIARRVPLSVDVLRAHADEVDWDDIADSYVYRKDAAFVRAFHDRIDWGARVTSVRLDGAEVDELVFGAAAVLQPHHRSVMSLIDLDGLRPHVAAIATPRCCSAVLDRHGPRAFDVLEDVDGALAAALREIPREFVSACVQHRYAPRKHADVVAAAAAADAALVGKFVRTCAPPEEYVGRMILAAAAAAAALPPGVWHAISLEADRLSDAFMQAHADDLDWNAVAASVAKVVPVERWARLSPATLSRQRLDEDYIDRHADALDWYELCEHQSLSEQLMRKHAHRLNWGQVSLYQAMSDAFLADFDNRINHVKLEMNKALGCAPSSCRGTRRV